MESPRLKGTARHSPSNLSLLGEEAAGRVLATYVLAVNASSGTEKADPGVRRLNRGHFGRHYTVLWRCESCPSVQVAFTGDKAEILFCCASGPHACLRPALLGARHDLSTAAPQCTARLRGSGSPPQLQDGRARAARHCWRGRSASSPAGGAAG